MFVFVRSPLGIVVSGIVTIAIAAFIYFVIVKPETDRANATVEKSLQQVRPQIEEANRQAEKARNQAQPQIDRANRIQNCIADAGGDPQKIAACQ
jgi:type II secretory pathway component PulM